MMKRILPISQLHSLQLDDSQLLLVELLQAYKELIDNQNISCFQRVIGIFKRDSVSKSSKPGLPGPASDKQLKRGIYLFGGVGRGKSMLLRLFFEQLEIEAKYMVHFHQFMLQFHHRLHEWQQDNEGASNPVDPLPKIAEEMTRDYKVICLDELQINNIADGMLLSRLFEVALSKGIFLFVTSNFAPQHLFMDGMYRERLLPFIELIQEKLSVFHLDNSKDYRLEKIVAIESLYYWPLDKEAQIYINSTLSTLISEHLLGPVLVNIDHNREIKVLRSYGKVAVFTFNELCKIPLGAIDYIALCKRFSLIIIENIPTMGKDDHNEALRFMTLIDTMYEYKTQLICTAEVPIDELYQGSKHKLEFARTISRLYEMQTAEYLDSHLSLYQLSNN